MFYHGAGVNTEDYNSRIYPSESRLGIKLYRIPGLIKTKSIMIDHFID
jgi:hypothetical protein